MNQENNSKKRLNPSEFLDLKMDDLDNEYKKLYDRMNKKRNENIQDQKQELKKTSD